MKTKIISVLTLKTIKTKKKGLTQEEVTKRILSEINNYKNQQLFYYPPHSIGILNNPPPGQDLLFSLLIIQAKGKTCFANCVFQLLNSMFDIQKLLDHTYTKNQVQVLSEFNELQKQYKGLEIQKTKKEKEAELKTGVKGSIKLIIEELRKGKEACDLAIPHYYYGDKDLENYIKQVGLTFYGQQDAAQFLGCILNLIRDDLIEDSHLEKNYEKSHLEKMVAEDEHIKAKNKKSSSVTESNNFIPIGIKGSTIQECVTQHFSPELLTDDNQVKVHLELENGKKTLEADVDAKKTLKLVKIPETLLLHLKRFDNLLNKIPKPIIPSLKIVVEDESGKKHERHLSAIICHQGEKLLTGHYVIYILHEDGWYLYNDELCKKVNIVDVLNEGCTDGYIFSYTSDQREKFKNHLAQLKNIRYLTHTNSIIGKSIDAKKLVDGQKVDHFEFVKDQLYSLLSQKTNSLLGIKQIVKPKPDITILLKYLEYLILKNEKQNAPSQYIKALYSLRSHSETNSFLENPLKIKNLGVVKNSKDSKERQILLNLIKDLETPSSETPPLAAEIVKAFFNFMIAKKEAKLQKQNANTKKRVSIELKIKFWKAIISYLDKPLL